MSDFAIQKLVGRRLDERMIENTPIRGGSSLELGVIRYFGGKDINDSGLLSGWAVPEPEHNWNDGCQTVFQTLVADPAGPCTIDFRGEPFINDKCVRQDVMLHVNGFQVGYWRLTQPSACTLVAKVEREQLFPRGSAVLVKLAWSFPDSVSPFARGLSNDSRELAFCFRSILISKS